MKLGFSGEAFGNLILLMAIIVLIVVGIIFFIAHKKGIDVTARSFQLKVGMVSLIIFGVIPFLLTDSTINTKIIGTILALCIAIANYFAIDKMQQKIREHFGDKKKTDKMDDK